VTSFLDARFLTEDPRSDALFGINDEENSGKPAYTTTDRTTEWVAQVENAQGVSIRFIPVDKNIPIVSNAGLQLKACDGMLTLEADKTVLLFFVELKTGKTRNKKQWISDGIDQLTSTIHEFSLRHADLSIHDRRAYICNSRHPLQREFSHERSQRFLDNTGFLLKIDHLVRVSV
jgi:hypothetical protein